jgi:two-component system, OmpR family, response regulator MprA
VCRDGRNGLGLNHTEVTHRILVVEDDADLRHLFSTHLRLAGFHVDAVGDGLAALRHLDEDPPDLLVLDLGLPFVPGEYIAREVAARAHTHLIPVVVVTGQPAVDVATVAACVLTKPVELGELVSTVKRCLSQSATASPTVPLVRRTRQKRR